MKINIDESKKLILRAAAVIVHEGRLLLHRADFDDFWGLPGGGCDFFESSEEALVREMKEELGAHIEPIRLCWASEVFFEWDSRRNHEVGFYYLCRFVGESEKLYAQEKFEGQEIHNETKELFKLHFQWFDFEELAKLDVRPRFLKEKALDPPAQPEHIVFKGELRF